MTPWPVRFADFGLYVFPIIPGDKVPYKDFKWTEEATNDPDEVREYLSMEKYAGCNWACVPGLSKHTALDIDVKNGKDGIQTLRENGLELPEGGFRVATPHTGMHVYLDGPMRGWNGKARYPGLEVKSIGGYVLIPGSRVSDSDKPYRVLSGALGDFPPVPDWLYDLAGRSTVPDPGASREPLVEWDLEHNVQRAIAYLEGPAPEAHENHAGDNTTVWVAMMVKDFGVSEQETLRLMAEYWNDTKAYPPWRLDDLAVKVHNGHKYGRNAPGSKSLEAMFRDFPDPLPFPKLPEDRLPVKSWPPVLRDFAVAASIETETPVELSALMILGCLAAACQRGGSVRIKPGYEEPCCLFINVVLDSGTRKSAEAKRAVAPILKWEKKQRRDLEGKRKEFDALQTFYKGQARNLQAKASKVEFGSEEEAQLKKQLVELEQKQPEVLIMPRVFTSDVTPEHLSTMMQDQGGVMAVISAEAGIFETMGGRYNNQVPNIDLYLNGHAGDPIRIDRASKDSIILDNPRLTMALTCQPDVIKTLNEKAWAKGRGLLARFLFCFPPSGLGERKGKTPNMSPKLMEDYENLIISLLDYGRKNESYVLELSSESKTLWSGFFLWVEERLKEGGDFEDIKAWAGKFPGAVGRIAALFHIARHGVEAFEKKIGEEDMVAGIETGKALAGHAAYAFDVMVSDPTISTAGLILDWIKRNRKETFTRRDFYKNYSRKFKSVEALLPAFKLLEERDYIKGEEPDRSNKSGRPKQTIYYTHPSLL